MHPLRIHAYVQRRVRNRELGCNETILIVVIRCETARAANRPYTMRLLPDFLVPGSVVRLDHVQEAYEQRCNGAADDRLCTILGCVDERTVRRHLRCYTEALETVSLGLAERRAMSPELGDLPDAPPDIPSIVRLERLWRAEHLASQRRGEALEPMSLRQLVQTALRKSKPQKPSGCVSVDARPP